MKNKMKNFLTIFVFVMAIALPANMVKAFENDAEEWVNYALKNKTFYHFNTAYAKIMAMPDNEEKSILLEKLVPIEKDVKSEDINKVIVMLTDVAETGSAKTYAEIEQFITNSKMSDWDKGYLLGELTGWGKKLVWTEDYIKSVDALRAAWDKKDSESINRAETIISQVKNKHSREYLMEQLNPLKVSNSSNQTENKVLTTKEIANNNISIVTIIAKDKDNKEISSGSGFITSSDGEIVTTYDVIDGANYAEAILVDGTKYNVSGVLASNPGADIAVLKLENASDLTPIKLGDSDKLKMNDGIVIVGDKVHEKYTYTSSGWISGLNQISYIREGTYIQFKAAIPDGSIGAPLFNKYGNVAGVIYSTSPLGFAIPINEVKQYLGKEVTKTLAEVCGTMRPQAPTEVVAAAISDSEIKIQWKPVIGVDYYYVYYRNSNGAYEYIKNDDGTKKQFQWQPDYSAKLNNIPNKKTVYFKVTSVRKEQESKSSNIAWATTFPKLEFFKLLSDVPVIPGVNYRTVEGKSKDGKPIVSYFYKFEDIDKYATDYYNTINLFLRNNGWESYPYSTNSNNPFSMRFKKGDYTISFIPSLFELQITGEIH